MNAANLIAKCPKTGTDLRPASTAEAAAWHAAQVGPVWTRPTYVRAGDVFVYDNVGPGVWFGGAGF